MTTIDSITSEQCSALANEAARMGDIAMCDVARRAASKLSHPTRDTINADVIECLFVIQNAEAQS